MKCVKEITVKDSTGKILYRHWYVAGGHVYNVSQGKGKKPALVCFAETPHGDGKMLWEINDGRLALETALAKEFV